MVQCPICSDAMRVEDRNGTEVDVCPNHGIWLDKSELLSVTEAERHASPDFVLADWFRQAERPPVDEGRSLSCPKCNKPMKIEFYENVHMDWCEDHGVFLDAGELEAILNNLRLDPLYVRKVSLRLWEKRF